MKSPKKETKKVRKTKKGGTVELAPLAAAGLMYAAAHYGKKGRKVRGGSDDVVTTSPGGSVPIISSGKPDIPTDISPAVGGTKVPAISIIPADVRRESPATAAITGSASKSPLVTGNIDLSKNDYVGATRASRPAPVNAASGLLQGGGAEKIDYLGGTPASRPAPVDTSGMLLEGGADKRKKKGSRARKQKGGDDMIASRPSELMPVSTSPSTPLPPVPSMASQSCGHIGASIPPGTSSGGKLGLTPAVPGAVGGVKGQEEPSQFGGAKKRKDKKGKKRGGAEDVDGGSAEELIGEYKGGGKKRGKGRKSKKQGGDGCTPQVGGDEVVGAVGGVKNQAEPASIVGGKSCKKERRCKKRGGADVEPFDAASTPEASALGGFDSLLVDLKKQVGGKYKHKGGAFKLYAKELSALSKKLKKLV